VPIRVYRIPFSTNVERVALALAHKRLAVEWVDVPPGDRTRVRSVSGQELVPVLEADGEVVADSTAILEWLEERHPDPPLYPAHEPRRTEVRLFVDWFNRVWKHPPNAIEAEYRSPQPDEGRIGRNERRLRESLPHFERLLDGRDFLYGDFGVADVAAFPFLKYGHLGLPPGDDERFHRILADNLALDGRYPRVAAWVDRVDARPRA
jgi:glutathione S-transferase